MKKAIISIVMLILLIMVYTNVMSALGSISNVLNGITNPLQDQDKLVKTINGGRSNISQLNPAGNQTDVENLERTQLLESGVYTVDQINETVIKEVLDPTDWYVGNTALSSDYAYSVYNDTLKVVENSTETSKSIIEKFLGIFKIGTDNNETQNGLGQLLEDALEKVQNITKSTENYLDSIFGDDQ
ncbi:hypothetical protein A0127_08780 [Thermococcus peptonophilus]|uniref:Uncharacterized protein n=2 Tax=Thermococcus peptonophilus TaxID=53952 RepID=A0A142CWU9_9EURY|nr:hypothetical protein A0127_08780 [Thermococcus peptonophilus]